jgi:hypothetical protein
VLQGKYALDPKNAVDYKPDIVTTDFSDLLGYGGGGVPDRLRGRPFQPG